MTQLNTPYPATAYLSGFLAGHAARLGLEVSQADPALTLFLRLFSPAGLEAVRGELLRRARRAGAMATMPRSVAHFLGEADAYAITIAPVIRFLQGRDPSLALRIATRTFLPEGPRFAALAAGPGHDQADPLAWAFGELGTTDRARHLASLYIDDLADVIHDGIDPHFELSRYGERLAASATSFDPLAEALGGPPTLVGHLLDELTAELVATHRPDVVGLSVPFPGNVYGAFRMAQAIRRSRPAAKIVLGGGYVNTELRDLSDPRVFDYVDFITLDDGERPLLAVLEHLADRRAPLFRTFVRDGERVIQRTDPSLHDVPMAKTGTPTYRGLELDRYVSLFEMLNPMHRLWADGRWNKLTVARGCYWKKCTFCDVTLDYIARYDPASAELLVDRIEALVAETGQTGFHFVDEAAPPAGLRALAETLLRRNVAITWWGNIRFEKTFTPALAELFARSGCVAVSGGLEVASDRLLAHMKKGVTVAQVARVTRAFSDAGIMVHAYLMYGFPTETTQETIDALERVRQLFAAGCLQSAFWHRFAATVHSPIGKAPEVYGIRLVSPPEPRPKARPALTPVPVFARNDLAFIDPTGTDHDRLGVGLRKALYNYMHGLGLDLEVHTWFDEGAPARRGRRRPSPPAIPKTSVPPDLIARALAPLQPR
jgi:radical SAM superfamily enzyme YgiQ (UPF0313 family)